jgi:hypothetical protein
MVALVFLSVVAAVFVTVVALEGGDAALERRPRGLLTWIATVTGLRNSAGPPLVSHISRPTAPMRCLVICPRCRALACWY